MDKEGVKPARGWTECPHPAHKKVLKEAACSIHLKKNKLTYTQPKSKRQMFEYVKTQRNKTFKKKRLLFFHKFPRAWFGIAMGFQQQARFKDSFGLTTGHVESQLQVQGWGPPNHFPNMIRVVCS